MLGEDSEVVNRYRHSIMMRDKGINFMHNDDLFQMAADMSRADAADLMKDQHFATIVKDFAVRLHQAKQQRDQAIALADQYRQLADHWCPDDARLDELGDEFRQLREATKNL